jgi:hypothetical protein
MKQTKSLNEVYPIPLMPYSFYIQENMRLNDEIMHANKTIGSIMPKSEEIAYHEQLGKDYQLFKKPLKLW